jgi:N-methylhydantoinase A/oxoprolinase/acetone carboxylase beta subunit
MEFVTFRVIGTVNMERPVLDMPNAKEATSSLIDRRRAYFAPHGFVDTEFHAGGRLRIGQNLQGPCIIQRAGDTVVLPPNTSAFIDPCGGIVITLE